MCPLHWWLHKAHVYVHTAVGSHAHGDGASHAREYVHQQPDKPFRNATEIWSMYRIMGPMNGKGTVSGPISHPVLTLQPLKLALELLYELIAVCHLILQSGQAFPFGPDLMCKAIRICGGGARVPRGAVRESRARSS